MPNPYKNIKLNKDRINFYKTFKIEVEAPSLQELQKQVEAQVEPQRKIAIPDVIYDGLEKLKNIYESPHKQLEEGVEQLKTNPIAGAGNIALGGLSAAFTLTGFPQLLTTMSTGLRSIGLDDLAGGLDNIANAPSIVRQNIQKGVDIGLEQIGLDKAKQTQLIKDAATKLIATGNPGFQVLTPLTTDAGLKEVQSMLDETTDLVATALTFKKIGDTLPKKQSPIKVIEETVIPKIEAKPSALKDWLENQPDVVLEKKQNLGVTGKGEQIGAFTQKTPEGFKVSYADYTPETSFAKEIGRVLAGKTELNKLKEFAPEFEALGFKEGVTVDKFALSVKELITNPESIKKAPKLTAFLNENKIPFIEKQAVPNLESIKQPEKITEPKGIIKPEETKTEIPEVPTTETQRKGISAKFESNIKEKSHFNSLKNFTNDIELNQYLTEVGKGVEKPRGVMTEKIVNELASTLGIREKDILRLQKGETKNVEQITGMRQVLVDNLNSISKFVKDNDKLTLGNAQQLRDMFLTHQTMQTKVMGAVSESARVLQSLNRKIDAREFDILTTAYQKLKDAGIDVTKPENTAKAINKLLDPTFGDKTVFWWYQSLLANPLTDVANITGNTGYLGAELVTKTIFEPQHVPQTLRGVKEGLKEFRTEAKQIWLAEQKQLSKWDFEASELRKLYDPSPNNIQNKLLRGVARTGHILLPTNRLRMEDALFRNIAKNIEKEIGVKKISAELKENPDIVRTNLKNLEDAIKNETKDVKDLTNVEKRYQRTIEDYQKYARELTFVEPLGKTANLFQRVSNSNAMLKWMFPFIRIGVNLWKEGLKHTPYYIGKNVVSGNWGNLSPRQKTTMTRRAIAGTSIMSVLEYLQSQGKVEITGDGPGDKNKREVWLKAGYKPNHIYVKGEDGKLTGIPYSNINPFGLLLAVRGNIGDYSKYDTKFNDEDNTIDQKVSLILGKLGNTILDQSFLWGAQSMVESMERGDANLLAKILTSPMPNIGGAIRGIEGEYTERDKLSFWDNVKYKIGVPELGLSSPLKPKIDISGEEKQSGYRRFPYQVSSVGENGAMKFIIDNDISLGIPTRPKINGKVATDDQYQEYKIISGRALQERLNKILPLLKRIPVEKAEKIIRDVAEEERLKAKNKIKPKFNFDKF